MARLFIKYTMRPLIITTFSPTMKHYLRIVVYAFIATFFALSPGSHSQTFCATTKYDEANPDIKFDRGRLSVKLKNAPLDRVLKEIMAHSGARIWLSDSIDTAVTIEFHDLPIRDGVHKILKDKNYAFVYTPNEKKEGGLSFIKQNKSDDIANRVNDELFQKSRQKPTPPPPKKGKGKNERMSFDLLAKDALESTDASKREDAVIALGESKDKRTVEILSRVLASDPSEDVRLSSIDAMIMTGDKNIVEPLSIALKDLSSEVRQSALEALAEVGGDNSQELIKGALNDEDNTVSELAQELLDDLKAEK